MTEDRKTFVVYDDDDANIAEHQRDKSEVRTQQNVANSLAPHIKGRFTRHPTPTPPKSFKLHGTFTSSMIYSVAGTKTE